MLTPVAGTWLVRGADGTSLYKVRLLAYYANSDGTNGQVGGRYLLRQVTLDGDSRRVRGAWLPLRGGQAQLAEALPLPALAQGEGVVVISGAATSKSDAPFVVRVREPPDGGSGPDGGQADAGTAAPMPGGCSAAQRAPGPGAGWLVGAGLLALLPLRQRRRAPVRRS